MNLAHLASAVQLVKARADVRPLDFMRWTPPQRAFLSDPSPVVLLRGANQIGKSMAGLASVVYRCTHSHPFIKTPDGPQRIWILTHSWEQSAAIQHKLWELLPKDLLDADTEYRPGRGFRGKTPIVRFRDGSLIRIKTTSQGSLALASDTLDYVLIDEPPPQAIWGEISARVLRRRDAGIGICMTPVGRPCGWLRELCEQGKIIDHPAPLTLENVTPEGGRPLLTQEQIDDIGSRYLAMDRDARLLGAWECISPDRCFDAFGDQHISKAPPTGGRQVNVCVGMDHGADAGSECAVLVAIDRTEGDPRIYILDEYTAGSAPPDVHARGLLDMLRRNGLQWSHLDRCVGDRAYGGKRWGGRMSNSRLSRALESELHTQSGGLNPQIRTAWKPRGSVYTGVSVIHTAMVQDRFRIHPRCADTIRSLRHFSFKDDEYKHHVDATRYSLEMVTRQRLYAPNAVKMY